MKTMTSMERVMTTLGHAEPDRVPLFLLLTMQGAREFGVSIRDYFTDPELVAEGQIRLQKKFRGDCLSAFYYAPLEVEAFGGEVIYTSEGPPNSGLPFIRDVREIHRIKSPRVKETPVLQKVLKTIAIMKRRVQDEIPIIGVVMSPFSLPVMQLGFDKYLEIMHWDPLLFETLMKINEDFCVEWANAQLMAGATAICYFDPVSSTTIITREKYLETGFQVACRTLARINGPTATHLASGRSLPIIGDIALTGTAVVGTSTEEDIGEMKKVWKGKLTVLGNLNGIEMRKWTPDQAKQIVHDTIRKAAPGGGFILSDNHGEIPFQVSDEILFSISEAVEEFGIYPVL